MQIRKVESFLEAGGKILQREFCFMAVSSLNSLSKKAFVRIRRPYALANGMVFNVGDPCKISIALDAGKKTPIFEGSIDNLIEAGNYYCLEAKYSALGNEEANETYRGISYKEAFMKLSDTCIFEAEDFSPEQIIFEGKKSRSFFRLVQELSRFAGKPYYYWLSRDNRPVVKDRLEASAAYDVGQILYEIGTDSLILIPVPRMEIGDRISLGENEYRVKSLIFDTTGRAVMICGVQRVG